MDKLEQNARDQALLVSKDTEEFEKAFNEYFVSLDDLEEGSFWQLNDVFVRFLRRQITHLQNGISEIAAKEFFETSESRPIDTSTVWYTFSEAIKFAKTWRKKERNIEISLSRLGLEPSFASGILMLGNKPVPALLSKFKDNYDVFETFRQHVTDQDWAWSSYNLLRKANKFKIATTLQETAKHAFFCKARRT